MSSGQMKHQYNWKLVAGEPRTLKPRAKHPVKVPRPGQGLANVELQKYASLVV